MVPGASLLNPVSLQTSSQRLTKACQGSGSRVLSQTMLPQDSESHYQSPKQRLGGQLSRMPSTGFKTRSLSPHFVPGTGRWIEGQEPKDVKTQNTDSGGGSQVAQRSQRSKVCLRHIWRTGRSPGEGRQRLLVTS